MAAVIIQLTKDDKATPFLKKIGSALQSPSTRRVFGRAVIPVLEQKFHENESQSRSTLGHIGYWDKAADSIQQPNIESDGVSVSVNKPGVALHYFGGTVKPGKSISRFTGRPTTLLTLPARTEAYGKSAGEFNNLKMVWGKGGRPVALAEDTASPTSEIHLVKSKNGVLRKVHVQAPPEKQGGLIMFWLVPQVTIQAKPDVIPQLEEMALPAFHEVVRYLEEQTGKKANQS
jgi:hypothetical protein